MIRVFAALVLMHGATTLAAAEAVITLDPGTRHQTISGWEMAIASPWPDPFLRHRDALVARMVDEIGINRVRIEARSGAESRERLWQRHAAGELPYKQWRARRYVTLNDNEDPFDLDPTGFDFVLMDRQIDTVVRPMRERLATRGERLDVTLTYVAFTRQIEDGPYIHDDPEEYAEFVLAAYQHIERSHGFVPDRLEILLEPDLVPQWDGTTLGRAMVAAARRLAAAGYTPRFAAPSVSELQFGPRYFDAMAAVPGALIHLTEVSYHRYGDNSPARLDAMRARADAAGLPTAMLELWFEKAGYSVLHEDLKRMGNTAWQGHVDVGFFGGYTATPRPDTPISDATRYNRLYFVAVRAGATRIGAASSDEAALDPLAFINADGSHSVVIKAKEGGKAMLRGLPAGRYSVSWAVPNSARDRAAVLDHDGSGALKAEIPGPGVLLVTSYDFPD